MKRMFCIIGLTGAGKSSYLNALLKEFENENLHRLVYYTTRKPRPNEVDGVDYHFVDRSEVPTYTVMAEDGRSLRKNPILIEHRLYKTMNNGYVDYFTTVDCVKEDFYLCAPSIEQLNSYIQYFGDSKIDIIEIKTDMKTRMIRVLNNRSYSDDDIYELCRRIVQEKIDWEKAGYDKILERYKNIGYISVDNSSQEESSFSKNMEMISNYIWDKSGMI
ncbi:MAG: 50S ribosome-binding GTPase [Acholeplasmatales bacterium]|nr:50S ribosome-binding GTPase [Acholeplasmatales bacterium]